MSVNTKIQSNVQEAWTKLSTRWQGEHAQAFHREHIVKISETVEDFETHCDSLADLSSTLLKELQELERSLAE